MSCVKGLFRSADLEIVMIVLGLTPFYHFEQANHHVEVSSLPYSVDSAYITSTFKISSSQAKAVWQSTTLPLRARVCPTALQFRDLWEE
jgi:hypothetical protein